MKSAQVCLLSLGCVGGAFAFGLAANASLDLIMPTPEQAPVAKVAVAKPAEAAQPAPAYALASTTSFFSALRTVGSSKSTRAPSRTTS